MTIDDLVGEIAVEFDRLRGTNVCGRGSGLERLIDVQTGRAAADAAAFEEFMEDLVARCPNEETKTCE